MEKLLEKNIPEIFRSDKLNNVIIFGFGGDGMRTKLMLEKYEIEVEAFCDNDPNKWKSQGGGEVCISPQELQERPKTNVVIGTENYCDVIAEQLNEYKNISFTTGRAILFWRERSKLKKVYEELLFDEESKKTYLILIEALITGNMKLLSNIYSPNQYFAIPEFAVHKTSDVFVDCGASVGDSIEQFIYNRLGAFNKIYSFEPMPKAYKAMLARVKRLEAEWAVEENKIICLNMGVSDITQALYFNCQGVLENTFTKQNLMSNENESFQFISLDDYFMNKEERITFIKADIETFETKLLEGAKNIIQRDRPNLAICIYHKFDDIFEIPLKIQKMHPKYKMKIRHHGYNFWETVLYAYI